ncbi:beta-galactosidase [Enterococcus sp. DIV1314a]|uniref:beta-galactosidase n=1 Tax=Enterococcus sp. DIV1314a TaxID=2774660 RepID=UPI003F28C731
MNNKYEKERRLLHGGDYSPEQWLSYPDILADDLIMMKDTHSNTVSLGMFSWSALEPTEGEFNFDWLDKIINDIYKIGGNIILATPSGARPAWMSQKYPEVLRTNNKREKMLHGGRHNHCYSSPVYREKTSIINKKLAERYGEHPGILMWHISNEYGGECHCNYCQESFRKWLKNKYITLENLNNSWWNSFWSHSFTDWLQVESPSSLGEENVHGLNLDWKRFVTDQTIDFYKHEIKDIRKITPTIPITTNFMGDVNKPAPHGSTDYHKFAKHVDIISWDCYPNWHNDYESTADLASKVAFLDDHFRSMKKKSFLIMESTPSSVNWQDFNKAKRPGMHLLSSIQHIAHGSDSNLYFQWRKSRGSSEKFHGAVIDHDNSTENRVYQDVKFVGEIMERIKSVKGSNKNSKVAIIYDWNNHWAFEDSQGFASSTKKYTETLHEHYRYFWNHDISVDIIPPSDDLDNYDLVIAPMLYLISEDDIENLCNFVKNGGILVGTYITGIVNEFDLIYLNGFPEKLQKLFGINRIENDILYPTERNELSFENNNYKILDYADTIQVNKAEVLSYYKNDVSSNKPAVVTNKIGKGRTYYIGARTEYTFLEDFYNFILVQLELSNPLIKVGDTEVSVQSRSSLHKNYHFVMNFSENNKTIEITNGIFDMVSGKKSDFILNLKPYEVRILYSYNKDFK